jgi:serine protease Do
MNWQSQVGVMLLSAMGFLWPAVARAGDPGDDRAALRAMGAAFTSIAKQATPAVVFIQVESEREADPRVQQFFFGSPEDNPMGEEFLERFFGRQLPQAPGGQPHSFRQQGQGSGFLISRDGYILTNNHVVGDADKITVTLKDGRKFKATRVGSDSRSEVAVIKIEGDDLPFLDAGDSQALQIGEWVVAIGNPFGLAETVTAGIVSAKGRSGMGIAEYEDFIQTDAAINPGNSGGPLLNIDGKVVGINTAIFSRSGGSMGIGFAIPIHMAMDIKEQLVKTGSVSRGFLGLVIQDVTPELAESFGLDEAKGILVAQVNVGGAAEKAGVKEGDVIVSLDGKDIENVNAFRHAVAARGPKAAVRLGVEREGKRTELRAVTGELPSGKPEAVARKENAGVLHGIAVEDLKEENARELGVEGGGAVVVSVAPGSPADNAGIRRGEVIVEVNRTRVLDAAGFRAEAGKTERGKALLLKLRSQNASRYVSMRVE